MWQRQSIKPDEVGFYLGSGVNRAGELEYGVWELKTWGWSATVGSFDLTLLHWQKVDRHKFQSGTPQDGPHLVLLQRPSGEEVLAVRTFKENGWVAEDPAETVILWQRPEPHMPPFLREEGCALIAVEAGKRNMRLEKTRMYAAFTCHQGQVRVFESGEEIPPEKHPQYSFCGTQYRHIVPAMQERYGEGDWTMVVAHVSGDTFGSGHHPYAVRLPKPATSGQVA